MSPLQYSVAVIGSTGTVARTPELARATRKPRSRGRDLGFHVRALGGIRTPNLLIRSQMLYPLSYERRASKSLTCSAVPGEIAPTGTLPARVRRTLDRSNRPCRGLVSTFTSTRCQATAAGNASHATMRRSAEEQLHDPPPTRSVVRRPQAPGTRERER